jgi:hypothetical protein
MIHILWYYDRHDKSNNYNNNNDAQIDNWSPISIKQTIKASIIGMI